MNKALEGEEGFPVIGPDGREEEGKGEAKEIVQRLIMGEDQSCCKQDFLSASFGLLHLFFSSL